MGRTAHTVDTKFRAVDKFTMTVKKMSASTRRFTKQASTGFARLNRFTRKIGKGFGKMLGQLGRMGLAFGAFAILSGAVKTISKFEQANADLASVLSSATSPELQQLQDDAKRLGAVTAKSATEVVGLQEAYGRLGFSSDKILNMTEATIAGSIALNGELADTAELTGAIINTFDNFSDLDTAEILDQLTLATQNTALNFSKLQTSLPIVAGAANAAGVPFTKLLSLLGTLSDAGIDASMSANSLKNIFIESAAKGENFEQIVNRINNSTDKLTFSNEQFKKRASVSGVILANNIEKFNELEKTIKRGAKGMDLSGASQKAADKRLDTLQGRVTLLKSAWEGFLLSLDDGTGKFSVLAKGVLEVATEILSMATGTAKAEGELNKHEKMIRKWAVRGTKFIKILGVILATFVALKAATIAYNGVMAIHSAITALATAKQWLLNAAMAANPIGLIIAALAAMVALITILVKKYDKWGAALSWLLGVWKLLFNVIMAFKRNWDGIINAFKSDGIIAGLKMIGATILDAVLMPLEQMFNLLAKIPGVGKVFGNLGDFTGGLREKLAEKTGINIEGQKPLNSEAAANEQRIKMSKNEQVEIGVTGQNGAMANILKNTGANISLNNTLGFAQ